mgnify:CR=1 FL=1|jgi:hypothetical protein
MNLLHDLQQPRSARQHLTAILMTNWQRDWFAANEKKAGVARKATPASELYQQVGNRNLLLIQLLLNRFLCVLGT